jgi:hypothetical protein
MEISKLPTSELERKNSEFPRIMRTHTSNSDVFGRVFIQREYEPLELSRPKVILDLSTSVGYSSPSFLSNYPTTKPLAVEADPGNYEDCRHNLKSFGPGVGSCRGRLGQNSPIWCSIRTFIAMGKTGRNG